MRCSSRTPLESAPAPRLGLLARREEGLEQEEVARGREREARGRGCGSCRARGRGRGSGSGGDTRTGR